MRHEHVLKEYGDNNVLQSTAEGLVVLLYDKCISSIDLSKYWLEKRNIEKTNEHLIKAQDIITYLISILDFQYEISGHLEKMYNFVMDLLIMGNIKKDLEKIELASNMMMEMRKTWKEAMVLSKQAKNQKAV